MRVCACVCACDAYMCVRTRTCVRVCDVYTSMRGYDECIHECLDEWGTIL